MFQSFKVKKIKPNFSAFTDKLYDSIPVTTCKALTDIFGPISHKLHATTAHGKTPKLIRMFIDHK